MTHEIMMGFRNYLIEGVSGSGKTAVAEELQRRGYHVIHGDRALAYLGDPETGEALAWPAGREAGRARWRHDHWIWDVNKVKSAIADPSETQSFFCGGSRNHRHFIHLFDGVFVLDIDSETLDLRLLGRPKEEFGGTPEERQVIAHAQATKEDIPNPAVNIDASAAVTRIVNEILSKCYEAERGAG
jgi:adenylate kinase family enzyme